MAPAARMAIGVWRGLYPRDGADGLVLATHARGVWLPAAAIGDNARVLLRPIGKVCTGKGDGDHPARCGDAPVGAVYAPRNCQRVRRDAHNDDCRWVFGISF